MKKLCKYLFVLLLAVFWTAAACAEETGTPVWTAEPEGIVQIDENGLIELINPEIVEKSEELQHETEGCLSLPGKYGVTERPKTVIVKAQNREGKWCVYKGSDLKARCFCHEIDHLDGILYTSHVVGELESE